MSDIPAVIERVLELSRADDCIVMGAHTFNANVRWANNTSTTNGFAEERELFVISIKDRKVGVVARTWFPDDLLEDIVRASEDACERARPAEDFMPLIDGPGTTPDGWDEDPASTSPAVLDDFATDLAATFDRARASSIELFGYAEHQAITWWLATSSGVRKRFTRPLGKVEITGKSPDFARSSWAGRTTATFDDVRTGPLFDKLADRLARSEQRVDLPAGRYEVLLEPSAVTDMALYQYVSSTRRDADEGRTVFSRPGGGNRIGETLMSELVTLYSDPHEPDMVVPDFAVASGSSSYMSVFDNGMPAGRVDWVRDGVLTSLVTPRAWARHSGETEAVPFIPNLIMPSDGPDLEQMIASTDRALLVTCLWYIREVDPQTLLLTGLTRDGVFLIEQGEIVGAANNFRFNMSPVQMFARTVETGQSIPSLGREFEFAVCRFPPLRVEDFNMSSVSEAT